MFLVVLFATSSILGVKALALDPDRSFYQYEFGGPSPLVDLPFDVLDVAQDAEGFLWIATMKGLFRYDGAETVAFRVSGHPGLPSNSVTGVHVDSTGRLFVSTTQGISVYDGLSFEPVTNKSGASIRANSFAEDADGVVWIASESGLWKYDVDKLTPMRAELLQTPLESLLFHGNKLYIGGIGKVFTLDGDSLTSTPLEDEFSDRPVRDLAFHRGQVWGACGNCLFFLTDERAVTFESEELAGAEFEILLADRDGNLWFASGQDLGRLFPNGDVERPDMNDPTTGYALEVSALFEDATGQQWRASRSLGLLLVRDTPIEQYSYAEGLPSTNVTALSDALDDSILIATDYGIATLTDGRVDVLIDEEFSEERYVRSLTIDQRGRLLLGTQDTVRIFSLTNDRWLEESGPLSFDGTVNVVMRGLGEDVLVGTDAGLWRVAGDEVTAVGAVSGLSIMSLMYDSTGELWIGSDEGLGRIVDGQYQRRGAEALPSLDSVVSTVELPSGPIVAATASYGILVGNDDQWVHIGEDNGIPQEQLIDVESRGDFLWLITGAGVFRVRLSELLDSDTATLSAEPIISAYSERYPAKLFSHCCRGENSAAAFLAQDTLVVATDDGVIMLDGSTSNTGEPLPVPFFKSANHGDAMQPIVKGEPIQLASESQDLTIAFSALQLARGEQVRFRHRLRGLSDEWVYSARERRANFRGLPAGDYIFELQATLDAGNWPSNSITLGVGRSPGIFESRTSIIAMWTLAVAIGALLIWLWLQFARRKHTRLEQLISRRTDELNKINEELTTANRGLVNTTYTDPLTELANRRYVGDLLSRDIEDREVPQSGILAVVDIDFFKRINDAHGHAAGDFVLRQFSKRLYGLTSPDDIVARWGGDEFLVISQDGYKTPEEYLGRLCDSISEVAFQLPNGQETSITCSAGAIRYSSAVAKKFEDHFSVVLDIADDALYAVKVHGRNGWSVLAIHNESTADHEVLALSAYLTGVTLEALIEKKLFVLRKSRDEISVSLRDTVTRLHRIMRKHEE